MQLVEAAVVSTGYVDALAKGVAEHVADLPRPPEPVAVDTSDRDAFGRFLPSFNERYRKDAEDKIGPGIASVCAKREGMGADPLGPRNSDMISMT